ncbi:hypothetical protein VHEMI08652 [[Torrubiella] hemipterigena]|uniref:Nucleoporin nsp1 n=1 Tax=[Torrubiella] hemipterigena TaxID=1531966 RepID=A0A0A1TNV0_9HYPO|nr:hypothetical protein VHEMI08652 [[Torrubiella] hemipterigena]
MVTFSLPGDADSSSAATATPRARAPLPFANRAYAASPYGARPSRHAGTPTASSSRKTLTTRDDVPASSINKSSMSAARNIFRASTLPDSPPSNNMPFSPALPQSTMKRVFAPGATPEPSRVFRASTAQATPRGMAAKSIEKDLFPMRIASPPRELTGELLAQKVPKEWNSKGSIYADQFLSHLCPPELDEEQRRQFFCILDLRRLKYAANEIFAKKDWKLNVINFAKEFEKSRSIILLRYGLYEFQNVKPSKEVLKRWRREHGLPEPEEESETPTPTKPTASKKRKADGELPKEAESGEASAVAKRRVTEKPTEPAPSLAPSSNAVLGKHKRGPSMDDGDEPTGKSSRPAPSAAKSLFEKIANKTSEQTKASDSETAKPVLFNANKPTSSGGLVRSVFDNLKSGASNTPTPSTENIFGYLSDTNSARNSGVEADAESDSESEEVESPVPADTAATQAPSVAKPVSSLFAPKPAAPIGDDDLSTAPGTRESTPGRSLFERVTKGTDGQPVRASSDVEGPAEKAGTDRTWNPTTTPLKFAPTAPAASTSLFKQPAATAAKSTPASSLFGAATTTTDESATPSATNDSGKDGDESDKENESQPASKSLFGAKPSAPTSAAQQPLGSLFQSKPAEKETQPAATPSLFGGATPTTTSNIFGNGNAATSTPATSATSLFGNAGSSTAAATKPTSLFGNAAPKADQPTQAAPTFSFGQASTATPSAPATTSSTPAFTGLFGNSSATSKPAPETTTPAVSDAPAPSPAPTFSFGANTTTSASITAQKPLFGAPKSPAASAPTNLFAGSPMKQDEASPAKKPMNTVTTSASLFSFGSNNATPSAAPVFGGATSNGTNNAGNSFGSATTNVNPGNSFGFNFGAGGSGGSFNNPFASASGANAENKTAAPSTGFSFTAGSNPSPAPSTSFQFGANTTPAGGSMFGANTTNNGAANSFGGFSANAAPTFNFGAQSAQSSMTGNAFGSNTAAPTFGSSLQPPAGGSSTTGTSKSSFPNRKIAPLKRRL